MFISSVGVNFAFTWAPVFLIDGFVHIKSRLSPDCLLRNIFIFVASILTNNLLTHLFAQMGNWGIFPNFWVLSRLPSSLSAILYSPLSSLLLSINCCVFAAWTVFSLTMVFLSFLVNLHISLYCEFWACYLLQPPSYTALKIFCDSPLLIFPHY